jgi:hypothetical protein
LVIFSAIEVLSPESEVPGFLTKVKNSPFPENIKTIVSNSMFYTKQIVLLYLGRIEKIAINRRSSSEELDSPIRSESSSRVLKKLYFTKFRYLGDSVKEAANKIGFTKKTWYGRQKE